MAAAAIMSAMETSIHSSSVLLRVAQLAALELVPDNLDVQVHRDEMLESVVVRLTRKVAYVPGPEFVTMPADWWQAFKERWFSTWMRLRWPVKMKTWEARRYLEDVVVPGGRTSVRFHELKIWTPSCRS